MRDLATQKAESKKLALAAIDDAIGCLKAVAKRLAHARRCIDTHDVATHLPECPECRDATLTSIAGTFDLSRALPVVVRRAHGAVVSAVTVMRLRDPAAHLAGPGDAQQVVDRSAGGFEIDPDASPL